MVRKEPGENGEIGDRVWAMGSLDAKIRHWDVRTVL